MKIIRTHPCDIERTGASPTHLYSLWTSSGTPTYAKDVIRRYESGGVMYDYRCRYTHVAYNSYYNPASQTWYWENLGLASTTGGYSYTTNVRLSSSPTWATGTSVALGQTVYDPADQSDYLATIAISSGYNTIRPSEAVLSTTATVAARWVRIGNGNAWAWNDYEISVKTQGYDANNALTNIVFTLDCGVLAFAVNAVAFSGLNNAATAVISVYVDGVNTQYTTKNLGTSPNYATSTVFYLASSIAAGAALKIVIGVTRADTSKATEVGAIIVGQAQKFADTEWDVETSVINYSRRERNQTFGTLKFVPRGSAKSLRATCFVDNTLATGDHVLRALSTLSGEPIYFDFNNDALDYDRLRIFGICTRAVSTIKTADFEILTVDVEGLVE